MVFKSRLFNTSIRSSIRNIWASAFFAGILLPPIRGMAGVHGEEGKFTLSSEYVGTKGKGEEGSSTVEIGVDQLQLKLDFNVFRRFSLTTTVGVQQIDASYTDSKITDQLGIVLFVKSDYAPYLGVGPRFKLFETDSNAAHFFARLDISLPSKARLEFLQLKLGGRAIDMTEGANDLIEDSKYWSFWHFNGFVFHQHIDRNFMRSVPILAPVLSLGARAIDYIENSVGLPSTNDVIVSLMVAYTRLKLELEASYTDKGKDIIKSQNVADERVKKGDFTLDKEGVSYHCIVDIPLWRDLFLRATGAYLRINHTTIFQKGVGAVYGF